MIEFSQIVVLALGVIICLFSVWGFISPDKFWKMINGVIEKDWVILLGDYDNEPVQRLASKTHNKLNGQSFIWIGQNRAPDKISNYTISEKYAEFLEENNELKHRLITFYYDYQEDYQLPERLNYLDYVPSYLIK